MMNKLLIATAVGAALLSVPAMAADTVRPGPITASPPVVTSPARVGIQGYAGIGGAFLSESGYCEKINAAAAGGALNVPLGGLNVEFEAAGAQLRVSGCGSPAEDFSYTHGAVHVFYRSMAFAIGGYGGFESPEPGLGSWFFGGEAQAYLKHVNLYGQVASQTFTVCCSTTFSDWYLRGAAQLFLTDNIAIEGDLRYNSDFFGSSATTFGGTAEMRFAMTPWSVFGTIRRTSGGGGPGNITTGLVGVRIQAGNNTLHQQYTTGASMNVLPIY